VRFSSPGVPGAWPALPIWVPLADVAETLGRFVDDTISRAATDAKTRAWADWLQQRWDAVRVQARQPEVARKWQHGEVVAAQWHMVENRLRDRACALAEVLMDSTPVQDSDTFAWLVGQLETTPRSSAAMDMEPLDVDWGLPPFTQGYRLAQRTRQVLGLGDRPVRAMEDLFAHFGVTGRAVQARGLFRSAVWTTESGATLVWAEDDARFRGEDPQRFAISAALGRLLANGLKARNHGAAHGDQARWRPTQLANAFAAELLLPIQALERPANLAKLSKQYGISQSAAKWHLASRKPDET